MIDNEACTEKFNPAGKLIRWIKSKLKFAKEHPDYFYADGLVVFCGAQGTGKTYSAVNYVYNLLEKYPKCKICTNLALKDYPIKTFDCFIAENQETWKKLTELFEKEEAEKAMFELYKQNNRIFEFVDNDDFSKYGNGENGMIFLVDEIQLYLNSLQSKNINLDVITQISQQRKQRKHIVCTSQVFGRMAKPLREQFSNVIVCKNYLGFIQCNRLIDRDSLETDESTGTELKGTVKRKFWSIHDPRCYGRYDTYRIIEKGKFVAGEEQQQNIYNTQERKEIDLHDIKSK